MALSGLAYAATYAIIRWTGDAFMKAGRKGKDLSKKVAIEMSVMSMLCVGRMRSLSHDMQS